jgi:hypothetical protein
VSAAAAVPSAQLQGDPYPLLDPWTCLVCGSPSTGLHLCQPCIDAGHPWNGRFTWKRDPAEAAAPEKRAAKRRAQREAVSRGSVLNPRHGKATAQMSRASSNSARKKAREGEQKLGSQRDAEGRLAVP